MVSQSFRFAQLNSSTVSSGKAKCPLPEFELWFLHRVFHHRKPFFHRSDFQSRLRKVQNSAQLCLDPRLEAWRPTQQGILAQGRTRRTLGHPRAGVHVIKPFFPVTKSENKLERLFLGNLSSLKQDLGLGEHPYSVLLEPHSLRLIFFVTYERAQEARLLH